jgi:hypothetical protein
VDPLWDTKDGQSRSPNIDRPLQGGRKFEQVRADKSPWTLQHFLTPQGALPVKNGSALGARFSHLRFLCHAIPLPDQWRHITDAIGDSQPMTRNQRITFAELRVRRARAVVPIARIIIARIGRRSAVTRGRMMLADRSGAEVRARSVWQAWCEARSAFG